MENKMESYFPVGIDVHQELKWMGCGLLVSFLISLTCPVKMWSQYNGLFEKVGNDLVLKVGARMPDFAEMQGKSLGGFLICALCAVVLLGYHYAYHFQGSKSIYLMRRLPDRREFMRRCAVVPAAAAVLALVLGVVLLLIYFGLYHLITPRPCLAPGQWSILWNYYF